MFNTTPTVADILKQLVADQHLSTAEATTIEEAVAGDRSEPATPWYVQGMIGLSAWLAAAFFVGAFFALGLADSVRAAIISGPIFCALATGLKRFRPESIFGGQLALALSLAGQVLFIGGLASESESVPLTVLPALILEGLLIAFYPDKPHRFISTLILSAALLAQVIDLEIEPLFHLFVVLIGLGIVELWRHEADLVSGPLAAFYRPVGYGLTMALCGSLLFSLVNNSGIDIDRWWLSGFGLLLLLFYLEYRILAYYDYLDWRAGGVVWLLGGTLLLIIPATQAPGIVAAITILLLGFQRGNRLLLGTAALFLVVFLIGYYYNMDLSLLLKSYILFSTGLALLGLRYLLFKNVSWFEVRQ